MRDRMENGLLMFLLRHHKPTVYSTYAQRLAVYEAYHARTGNTQFPPAPAFDFGSLIGLCEKSTDDVQDQGRLNADRIGLAIAGISAFGVRKTPSETDIAKYRDAVRRYSETLGQIASKNRKLH